MNHPDQAAIMVNDRQARELVFLQFLDDLIPRGHGLHRGEQRPRDGGKRLFGIGGGQIV